MRHCFFLSLSFSPLLQVSWFRRKDYQLLTVGLSTYSSDDRFLVEHTRHLGNWALRIKNARKEDEGLYECQISTHPPQSIFIELRIVGKSGYSCGLTYILGRFFYLFHCTNHCLAGLGQVGIFLCIFFPPLLVNDCLWLKILNRFGCVPVMQKKKTENVIYMEISAELLVTRGNVAMRSDTSLQSKRGRIYFWGDFWRFFLRCFVAFYCL